MSRTLNTKRNIITSYLNTLISFLFSFISRALIIRILGSSYLGLSSLFTSILQVLSMAELGFSAAVIYNMYAPLARGDTKTVCALLNFYRKVYAVIACVICVFGVLLAPFLKFLIKGSYPSDINLYLLYFLYLGNTVSSYIFFAYKTALLNALQRLDISKIAYTIASILQYLGQIIALLLFRSYYLFVVFLLLGTIVKNVLTAYLADRYFPQYQPVGIIPLPIRQDIISRVKGLMICSIASVTTTTLDSIALSAFIGLKSVAIYNNYLLIFKGVGTFIAMIRTAMQASVGNSVALETTEKNYADMLLWQFMFSFIATWCATCMFCLYQPFMEMWMGRDMLLQDFDIVVICAWFFTGIIQHSFFLYLAGTGSWWAG
ncbi:MAG: oligosaccharide flippase family protein [Synergistaceae bacterium]|nr:oligosaccharide flippase family protein [Synergistaceae bacterium]MBR0232633.1 oligosaccharide flippase family protein [Synergistaceae bacterium]MBR0315429.1 oligosaccharide flippase family protein [Synergistaceae bacterium]